MGTWDYQAMAGVQYDWNTIEGNPEGYNISSRECHGMVAASKGYTEKNKYNYHQFSGPYYCNSKLVEGLDSNPKASEG